MLKKLQTVLSAEIDPAFAKRAELIFQEIEKGKPKKVLDAGCGRGFYVSCLQYFSFIHEIHGVDLNEKYLAVAKKNIINKRVKVQKASLFHLPFKDNYFDLIICSEVLEHLIDHKKGLVEIKRVLKKGGTLLFTVPNKNFPFFWDPINWILMRMFNTHINKNIWWLAGIWGDHERLYAKNEVQNLIEKVGLKVEKVEEVVRFCWPFSHFLLYGVGKNLVERFGTEEFNRFSFKRKPISKFLARLFRLPMIFEIKNSQTSVTLFLRAGK